MRNFIQRYVLWFALGWAVVIFILCCTPGKYVPSAHWLDLLSFDKFVHATMFFILSSLWFIYFSKKGTINTTKIIFIILSCIAYGGILEILQATVFSQRSGDWLDFTANSFGCLVALLVFKKRNGS